MVSRYLVGCQTCGKQFVLRVQVGSVMSPDDPTTTQPFVCSCPNCQTSMRGRLHTVVGTIHPNLSSQDFDVLNDAEENPDDPAVTVATDTPVHNSIARGLAGEPMLTPFIQIFASLGKEQAVDLMERVGGVREIREAAYPALRRAAAAFLREDSGAVARTLSDTPGVPTDGNQYPPATILGFAFLRAFAPICLQQVFEAAQAEKSATFERAVTGNAPALVDLLLEFKSEALPEHTRRVVDTALTVLGDAEPLISALCAEQLEGTAGLMDYRVMRDDFDMLKARYQDVFELGSRSLVLMARVANVADRGDARLHVDGRNLTLKQALRLRAFDREAWLADFPSAKRMYDSVSRHTRNEIGHRAVRYDFDAGELVYDDGVRENYLLFLVDYLNAVRLCHYLLEVVLTFSRSMHSLS